MRARIRLETVSDCIKLSSILDELDPNWTINLTDGKNYTASARSFIGVCYSMEWKKIYIEWNNLVLNSDHDIAFLIRDFIIEDTDDDGESIHN